MITMAKRSLLAFALTLVAPQAIAQSRTFYDSSGRTAGRSTTDSSGSTTFYDASRRVSARSSTSGSQTMIYDSRGQILGRTTIPDPNDGVGLI